MKTNRTQLSLPPRPPRSSFG